MMVLAKSERILDAAGLTYRFGDATAVDDVTIHINRGETFGFLGRNGAGKSTTIRMLCGLLPLHAGRVFVNGVDLAEEPARAKLSIGYVPDQCVVYPWMRIGEAIGFCRTLQPGWNDALCDEMLRLFKLEAGKKVRELSKGMAAKLSLLLAIAHEPELLILDEPMSGLDPIVHDEFLDGVLRSIIDRGQTVMLSSHDLEDVQRLADTVGLIDEGRLLVHRPLESLVETTKRLRVMFADGDEPSPTPSGPPGMIWQQFERREWQLTVHDFAPDTLDRIKATSNPTRIDVLDMTLPQIFKDFVLGRETIAC